MIHTTKSEMPNEQAKLMSGRTSVPRTPTPPPTLTNDTTQNPTEDMIVRDATSAHTPQETTWE
jgi:hypothetical protein